LAVKGDKDKLGPLCLQLYKQGWTLTSLSVKFGVSATSLSKWKKETHRPGQDLDDWDLARQSHVSRGENLQRLFEDQQDHVLSLPVTQRDTKVHDALSKASANFRHWEEYQRAAAAALMDEMDTGEQSVEIDRPAIFLETLEWIALKLKETDPEGLKVLAQNFDTLVIQFKAEHAREQQ
jgi:transcriptional regulator with XRE-family HTH domain